jgi:DNA-directed RNA polymerase subunit alpha
MVEFVTPEKFVWEEHTDRYGRFVVEPLEKGYGVTIGNALRRVLLSSIEGSAPTAVKFEGVYHEFSTIPGVVEDVVEIVLNIKQLRFALHGEGPVFVELKRKGPGKVYAKEFKLPSQVELLTPEKEIATIDSENAQIEIHLRIDRGKGFVLSEDIQEIFDITTVGWIPLDADFSPIEKVAFRVEDTRVGRRTDYNRLTMEIWTDGSITPKDAVVRASNILIEHFSTIRDRLVEAIFATAGSKEDRSELLERTLEEAGFSGRALKPLKENGINTVADLLKLSKSQLKSIKGLGMKSIAEIEKFLSELGFELGGDKE